MPEASKLIDFIELTGATIKAAQAELGRLQPQHQKTAAEATQLATEAEKTADALITAEEFSPAVKGDLITSLQDHGKVLRFMAKLAAKRSAGGPTPVGKSVGSSEAVKTAGIIGAPGTGRMPSDAVFTKMMLGSN